MEKSVKKEKDISFVLDVRTVTKQGKNISLCATEKQCQELAEFYDLPKLKELLFNFNIALVDDVIELRGKLNAKAIRVCVVTSEEFEEVVEQPVVLMFSEDEDVVRTQENKIDFSPEDEYIELIENGRIYFADIVREQLGLAIDPFPKKTNELFAYYEEKAEEVKDNPFAILKHLTKWINVLK